MWEHTAAVTDKLSGLRMEEAMDKLHFTTQHLFKNCKRWLSFFLATNVERERHDFFSLLVAAQQDKNRIAVYTAEFVIALVKLKSDVSVRTKVYR